MTVQIHAVKFHADTKLTEYIEKRLERLQKYFSNIGSVEVFLKLENHGQIKDKIVEIKASVPGTTLMSKSVDKTFEASADEAQNSLINQIKKYKEKLRLNR